MVPISSDLIAQFSILVETVLVLETICIGNLRARVFSPQRLESGPMEAPMEAPPAAACAAQPVFRDGFADGLNLTQWYHRFPGRPRKGGFQDAGHAAVSNGTLRLRSSMLSSAAAPDDGGHDRDPHRRLPRTAMVATRDPVFCLGCYAAFRFRVPRATLAHDERRWWFAAWAVASDTDANIYEVDIVETFGANRHADIPYERGHKHSIYTSYTPAVVGTREPFQTFRDSLGGSGSIDDGGWHWAGAWRRSDRLHFFVDGILSHTFDEPQWNGDARPLHLVLSIEYSPWHAESDPALLPNEAEVDTVLVWECGTEFGPPPPPTPMAAEAMASGDVTIAPPTSTTSTTTTTTTTTTASDAALAASEVVVVAVGDVTDASSTTAIGLPQNNSAPSEHHQQDDTPVRGFLWVALVMAAALCGILLVRQVARRAWARHHDCRATAASRTKRPPRCKKRRKSVSRRSIQKVQPAESAASDD